MKNLICLFVALCALPLLASEQTLITGEVDHGGYGGPVLQYAQIGPEKADGILVGGQGGWIIDHKLVIGGGGYGLASKVAADWYDAGTHGDEPGAYILNFGYGGLLVEYISQSDDLIHFELFGIIGGGGVDYQLEDYIEHDNATSDAIFVAQPGANIVLNVTPFFRIALGVTYRYVSGVDLDGLTNGDLSGFGGQIVFKFGAF
ncbi:hypothetical protein JW998_15865 [candidate division KSB1 bacterium]|nr:hypothetical protein [candidate division KSB1 bacterium]